MLPALRSGGKGSPQASDRRQGISDKLLHWRNSTGTRAMSLGKAVEASAHTTPGVLLKQPDKHESANRTIMSDHSETLCDRAGAGDMSAASELVSLFYERIFAYFRRLCGNDDDAADLTQKTFFKVWTSLATFQRRSRFATWLHGIAHHVYVDWRRANRPADLRTDEWWEARTADGPSPFDDAAERDMSCRLFALVERLEGGVRDVVHLHYYKLKNCCAGRLDPWRLPGCWRNCRRTSLCRARRRLRRRIGRKRCPFSAAGFRPCHSPRFS